MGQHKLFSFVITESQPVSPKAGRYRPFLVFSPFPIHFKEHLFMSAKYQNKIQVVLVARAGRGPTQRNQRRGRSQLSVLAHPQLLSHEVEFPPEQGPVSLYSSKDSVPPHPSLGKSYWALRTTCLPQTAPPLCVSAGALRDFSAILFAFTMGAPQVRTWLLRVPGRERDGHIQSSAGSTSALPQDLSSYKIFPQGSDTKPPSPP